MKGDARDAGQRRAGSVANQSNRTLAKKTSAQAIPQLPRIPCRAADAVRPSPTGGKKAEISGALQRFEAMQKNDALMRTYDFYFADGTRNVSSRLKEIERLGTQASPHI